MPEKDESTQGQRRAYGHDLPVLYIDAQGKSRSALVTRWHDRHPGEQGEPVADLVTVGDAGDIARVPNVPHVSRSLRSDAGGAASGAEHWAWYDE